MREVQLDAKRERVRFDCILCPVGDGGLIAGTALSPMPAMTCAAR